MKKKIRMMVLATGMVAGTLIWQSCNTNKDKETTSAGTKTDNAAKNETTTNPKVEQTIKDLGLVYVEEGAQNIVTYDEVNAAQQAWCDALVKIGQLHKDGGDYKAFAEEVLSDAYNYDYGKVFFKPTLAYGEQTFRPTKKGADDKLRLIVHKSALPFSPDSK